MNIINLNTKQRIITLFCFFFFQFHFSQNNDVEVQFSLLMDDLVENQGKSEDLNIKLYFEGKDLVPKVNDSLASRFYGHFHWYFYSKGLKKDCVSMGKKALPLAKKHKDYYQITSITQHLIDIYVSENKLDDATLLSKELITYYDQRFKKEYSNLPKKDYSFEENTLSSYNNTGIFYSEALKQRDSALFYFIKSNKLPQVDTPNFRFLNHSINDNMALIYMNQSNFKKAKQLFSNNEFFYRNKGDHERWIRASLQWAQSEINLKEFTSAKRRLESSRKRLDSLGDYLNKKRNEILYNETMESLFLNRENYKKAKEYSNTADELTFYEFQKQIEINKKRISTYNDIYIRRTLKLYNQEKKLHKKERNVRNYISILLGLIVLVSILSVYLIYSKNKLKLQKASNDKLVEKERAKTAIIENKLLQKEIDYKKKDLALFANVISENQKWGNYLLTQIKSLKVLNSKRQKELISNLEDEINHKITLELENSFFQKRIQVLNSKFFENLLQSYPNLTKIELKLCSLIRLDIENKDIARIQNISPNSIYRSRTRLRKKLNLPTNVDLNIFLKNF